MIPVLSSAQMKEVDVYTMEHEPISSLDLMERASKAFVTKFKELDIKTDRRIKVFAGTGNNGGDALAVARLLSDSGRTVEVFTVGNLEKGSDDFKANLERLPHRSTLSYIEGEEAIPQLTGEEVLIDGLFGSGLSRPVEGLYAALISRLNRSGASIFSIDIPSGLYADKSSKEGAIVQAAHTISFQTPKLAFFQPTLSKYTGEWHLVDIGLNNAFIGKQETDFHLTENFDITFPQRSRFAHKGDAGRVLLVSGGRGKMGATSLSARAAMRTGCGLLYVHAPKCGTEILQINIQEAIVLEDEHEEVITEVEPQPNIDVVAVGPGIGTNPLTKKALAKLLEKVNKPMVLDADAINILSEDNHLMHLLPKGSILTPHPGEFKRLVGEWEDDFHKLEILRTFCQQNHLNMVVKGAYSAVCDTQGKVFFNCTGNPGLATAGSGDVLTGMISALLGQGFAPEKALKTGVYLQGLAADIAVERTGEVSMIASDILDHIPLAIIKNVKNRI